MHGPEVGFARAIYAAGWRDVAIIKVHTNFGRDSQIWPWGKGGPLFEAWPKFINARLAELSAQGIQEPTNVAGWALRPSSLSMQEDRRRIP